MSASSVGALHQRDELRFGHDARAMFLSRCDLGGSQTDILSENQNGGCCIDGANRCTACVLNVLAERRATDVPEIADSCHDVIVERTSGWRRVGGVVCKANRHSKVACEEVSGRQLLAVEVQPNDTIKPKGEFGAVFWSNGVKHDRRHALPRFLKDERPRAKGPVGIAVLHSDKHVFQRDGAWPLAVRRVHQSKDARVALRRVHVFLRGETRRGYTPQPEADAA